MVKAAVVVVSLVVLGACAGEVTSRVVYEKAGVADAERKRDIAECTTSSVAPSRADATFGAMRLDRPVFDRCMKERGYTPRPATSAPGTEMVPGDPAHA
jgi:hypothetical protein